MTQDQETFPRASTCFVMSPSALMEVPVVVMTEIAHDAFGGAFAVSVALFPLVTGEVSEVIFTESIGVGVRRGVARRDGVSVA